MSATANRIAELQKEIDTLKNNRLEELYKEYEDLAANLDRVSNEIKAYNGHTPRRPCVGGCGADVELKARCSMCQ